MERRLLALVQGLLRTLNIRLCRWVVSLTFEGSLACFALLLEFIGDIFLLLLDFGADRLLEEGPNPFGTRAVVDLPFLAFAGLGEHF